MPRDRMLNWMLSLPSLMALILLGSIPILWPLFSQYEGYYLPVVKNVHTEIVESGEHYVDIVLTFDKVRQCDEPMMFWFGPDGAQLSATKVDGDPELITLPNGNRQVSNVFRISGVPDLDGVRGIFSHRCHPLWTTYTDFYP